MNFEENKTKNCNLFSEEIHEYLCEPQAEGDEDADGREAMEY